MIQQLFHAEENKHMDDNLITSCFWLMNGNNMYLLPEEYQICGQYLIMCSHIISPSTTEEEDDQ